LVIPQDWTIRLIQVTRKLVHEKPKLRHPVDFQGESKDFWNKVDVEDLKRRGTEKSTNLQELMRNGS